MLPKLRMTPTRLSMFWATAAVVILGLAVAAIGSWLLGLIVFGVLPGSWSPGPAAAGTKITWLDPIKVALTIAAGVGGAVALVVAYRKQRMAERQELQSAYVVAASQLGDANPTVRLAGVYAMANLADAWPARQQQCIDVLCAHLRLPWNSNPDADHPLATKIVEVESGGTKTAFTYTDDRGEAEVRKTILRVMGEHFEAKDWINLKFDFSGAALPDVNWSGVSVPPDTWFGGATFCGDALFGGATFLGDVGLGATFSSGAEFTGATFGGIVYILRATFSGRADFGEASFNSQAIFLQTSFCDDAYLEGALFDSNAVFAGVTFSGNVNFDGATFDGPSWFDNAAFNSSVSLEGVTFNGDTSLDKATFNGDTSLDGATCSLPRRTGGRFVEFSIPGVTVGIASK